MSYLRSLIVVLALALATLAIAQMGHNAPAVQTSGNAGQIKAFSKVANQVVPVLEQANGASSAANGSPDTPANPADALACSLQTEGNVSLITGLDVDPQQPLVHADSMNQGMTCIWSAHRGTVGADILDQVHIGGNLDAAFQREYDYSVRRAHNSPTLGQTVTMLPGKANAFMISDTATHGLAVVTERPDLGLVVRYSADQDNLVNEQILSSWVA